MRDVFICDAVRTPIGAFQGTLAKTEAPVLGTEVIRQLLERNSLDGGNVDEVLMGCILQAGMGQNLARQAAINAGIPVDKTATTVNMVCGSGLRTVEMAAQMIKCEDADVIIAGGAESMTNAPYLLKKARTGYRMGNGQLLDSMIHDGLTDIFNNYHMGITAENIAEKYGISKEEQDEFAAVSQNKAEKAQAEGRFRDEIVPVTIPQRKKDPIVFSEDEYIKKGVTKESV
ncbi:MAG: beta-ketoacyl synthase N-terminal-like domain-containing protein, partial [Candidatus Muiribacteriaceae bacterium]